MYKSSESSRLALRTNSSMADGPNYSFYRHPRFSLNHVAEYITASDANQREGVIRAAKFPRKAAVIPYSGSKRTITGFLGQNGRDLGQIDGELARLRSRLATEADGWSKDELKRNIACLEQFKKVFTARRMKRFQ